MAMCSANSTHSSSCCYYTAAGTSMRGVRILDTAVTAVSVFVVLPGLLIT